MVATRKAPLPPTGGGSGLSAEDPQIFPENEEVPDRDFNGEA